MKRSRAKNADEETAPIQEQQCIAGGAHPFTQVMSEQQGGPVDTKGDFRLDQKHGLIG